MCVTFGQCEARPLRLFSISILTFPAYAGAHRTYPRTEGPAELTWVAGNIARRSPIQVLTGLDVEQLR